MAHTSVRSSRVTLLSAAGMVIEAVSIVMLAAFATPLLADAQSAPTALTGYAWSDTIGWISLNCSTDPNGCATPAGPWGILIDPASGVLSKYAWSDNIGWISANSSDLASCPTAPSCTAALANGKMTGWMRALSADNRGWDGWISLFGTGYGITYSNGVFDPCKVGSTSCAWGSDVVGWVDFRNAHMACTAIASDNCGTDGNTITHVVTATDCQVTTTITTVCVAPAFCSAGEPACLYPPIVPNFVVTPSLVNKGNTATVTWSVSGVKSCTVTADGNSDSWSGLSNGASPKTTLPITKLTTYTLSCVKDDPNDTTPYTDSQSVGIVPTYHEH